MRLEQRLRTLIQIGRLTVVMPKGTALTFGQPQPDPELDLVVQIYGRLTPFKLGWNPERELGEAYTSGRLVMKRGTIGDLMKLLFLNASLQPKAYDGLDRLRQVWVSLFEEYKTLGGDAGDAIVRHFNKDDVYRAFLGDGERQFSVGYFDHAYSTVDRAQAAGRRHLAAKLQLQPGHKILDVGCGWGAMAIWLAQTFDVQVTGYTLATEQLLHARDAVRKAALCDKVRIEAGDFRKIDGVYDRIIITGAFEHVGTPQYAHYFEALRDALTPDGVILLHSTGHTGPPHPGNPWVRRRLFPGSHVPALDVVVERVERAGLWITDLEILRLHGAETLRLWRENFADRSWLAETAGDERRRAWELFLAGAEMAFRYGDLLTFEAQITRRAGAVPMTRAYIDAAEEALGKIEGHLSRPPMIRTGRRRDSASTRVKAA